VEGEVSGRGPDVDLVEAFLLAQEFVQSLVRDGDSSVHWRS
jgi:hypothetical protein